MEFNSGYWIWDFEYRYKNVNSQINSKKEIPNPKFEIPNSKLLKYYYDVKSDSDKYKRPWLLMGAGIREKQMVH